MAKKKKETAKKKIQTNAYIEGAGIVVDQKITETLEHNYMPYAMSVIVSRALPEIDGFKPSHRKLLYTMYKMGLLTGQRTKSANIVGQTMRLNPHGDATIYETMVRLSRGHEALLHAYVDSKGNFGKSYSRDMAYAAARYTEAKLDSICNELFRDIDKNTVDFIANYDNTTTEPTLLPVTFPSVLVNANVGIAVSMASSICSFNLKEVCETTIGLLRDPEFDIYQTLTGPDFTRGGYIVYNQKQLQQVYETGRGSLKVRGRYQYDKSQNCIEVIEIPPSTTVEAIMDKIVDLVKSNKLKEISDMRDETDLSGLKLTLDLKRGVDPDKLMKKLFRLTPLEDNYSCNFNILVGGTPKVMGIREILSEWSEFRTVCVCNRVKYDLNRQIKKLHLLKGLEKILLDIDKAIRIVRETDEEAEVVPNLMIGFGIDEVQAEYVAEIKLRHLNREYILKRTQEIEDLEKSIADMRDILDSPKRVKKIIISELKDVIKKYGKPRKTQFVYADEMEEEEEEEEIPDYPIHVFLTQEGYFKKITPASLRMSSEQKVKEGDSVLFSTESTNNTELLFFSDKAQVYKSNISEFPDTKASLMGEFVPAKLGFDDGEKLLYMVLTKDYTETMLFFYENGKVAKVPLSAYQTKTKRKKLANAYSDKTPIFKIFSITEEQEFLMATSNKRNLLFSSAMINQKTTRNTIGVNVLTIAKGHYLEDIHVYKEGELENPHRYRTKTIPARGALLRQEDIAEQLKF